MYAPGFLKQLWLVRELPRVFAIAAALEVDRQVVVVGRLRSLMESIQKESKMKKLLVSLTIVGFALVGTNAASAAVEVVRTFVDGKYKYICTEKDGGHNCGNWNRAQ